MSTRSIHRAPEILTPAAVPAVTAAPRLVTAFLASRTPRTLVAYRQDVEDFRRFVGAARPEDAVALLLGRGHGAANELALAYRTYLCARGLAAATINRRLAALRSLTKLARTLGVVSWALDVEAVPAEPYRDTAGPGREGYLRLLAALQGRSDAQAARDRAMIRLLFDLALRRGEVVALDVAHVDLDAGTVAVRGKGRGGRIPLTLPAPTLVALRRWLALRGPVEGPLFVNFDRAGKGRRLTGTSLYRIVRALGQQVGVSVRPHGLRHAAITAALDWTGGDVRKVQRFSRHRDLRVLTLYDDNRLDLAGDVARLVAPEL